MVLLSVACTGESTSLDEASTTSSTTTQTSTTWEPETTVTSVSTTMPATTSTTTRTPRIELKITIWDRTDSNPLSEQAEVSINGVGSWSPELSYGADSREHVGPFRVGEPQVLRVYPDGVDGVEVAVEFRVTSDMRSNSDADQLWIDVYDEEVVVGGSPIRGLETSEPR